MMTKYEGINLMVPFTQNIIMYNINPCRKCMYVCMYSENLF